MENDEKILFAGPFVGEFGMELFEWQGYIRKLSESFTKTIISSRPDHKFIYEDFYSDFIPFDPQTHDCDGYDCLDSIDVPDVHGKHNACKTIRVFDVKTHTKEFHGKKQTFKSYKNNIKKEIVFDFCICARSFKRGADTKLERNWNINSCIEVVGRLKDMGFSIASVGLKVSSEHIPETIDLRDVSLEELSSILSSSKAIIGPSSGVMHFASLCECPQVVWGSDHLEKRYVKEWNPFNTKVEYIVSNDWNPSVKEIVKSIIKI